MGLKDLKLPTRAIQTPGGDFAVRGLSLTDIMGMFYRHRGEFALLYERFATANGKKKNPNLSLESDALGAGLLSSAPEIAAEVIAVAASEDGAIDADDLRAAAKLPMPIQLEALQAIGDLTFTADNSPKKVLAAVVRIAQGATAAVVDLQT